MTTRRRLVRDGLRAGAGYALCGSWEWGLSGERAAFEQGMAELERASGGRLGVAVLDSGTGVLRGYKTEERFPMCSTFKMLLAAAVLRRVDRGEETLGRAIRFTRKDILEYSPATEPRLGVGSMTVGELCRATVTLSDNTAGNLLLATVGGPAGLTAFLLSLGDGVTRLDRMEPELNEALPGDARDTCTPASVVGSWRALLLGGGLSQVSAGRLADWLVHTTTGGKRLRAGLPKGWKAGDKTGTGSRGTTNDVAILWPPARAPVLAAVFLTGATVDGDARERTIAEVGRRIPALLPA